jgi:hypothetical protein
VLEIFGLEMVSDILGMDGRGKAISDGPGEVGDAL